MAVAGGAATGAGGFLTSALDVPFLLALAMRTILKVGHCYGEPLDRPEDRRLVLGVLMIAATDDPEKKRELIARLGEIEDWMVEETEEQLVADEAMEFLLQVEIFNDIPGLGAITAGVGNFTLIHNTSEAARRIFQERWLQANGKVDEIEPAAAQDADWAWDEQSGFVSRWIYAGSYYVGFGMMVPVWTVAHALAPADNAVMRGIREGAAAAVEGADRTVARLHSLVDSSARTDPSAPALASG